MAELRRWFITGVSSGLGRALAVAALDRGDTVTGTLRDPVRAAEFATLAPGRSHAAMLDVTDDDAVPPAIDEAARVMGGLDILVNNAGYCLAGPIEAISLGEARAQLETNLFGAISVIQAALPHMRHAGGGHIVNIGSLASVGGFPGMGLYCASKFALAGLSEALAAEVSAFGVKVTVVEPSGFRTRFAGASLRFASRSLAPYFPLESAQRDALVRSDGSQINDPGRGAQALLALVDHADPPLHFALGVDAAGRIRTMLERRLADYTRADPDGAATAFETGSAH